MACCNGAEQMQHKLHNVTVQDGPYKKIQLDPIGIIFQLEFQ